MNVLVAVTLSEQSYFVHKRVRVNYIYPSLPLALVHLTLVLRVYGGGSRQGAEQIVLAFVV